MNATPVITKLMNPTQKLSRLNFIPVLGFFTFFMISIFSQNPEKIEMTFLHYVLLRASTQTITR